jgi:hypothetical protein
MLDFMRMPHNQQQRVLQDLFNFVQSIPPGKLNLDCWEKCLLGHIVRDDHFSWLFDVQLTPFDTVTHKLKGRLRQVRDTTVLDNKRVSKALFAPKQDWERAFSDKEAILYRLAIVSLMFESVTYDYWFKKLISGFFIGSVHKVMYDFWNRNTYSVWRKLTRDWECDMLGNLQHDWRFLVD